MYGLHIVELEEAVGNYTHQVLNQRGVRVKYMRFKDLEAYPGLEYICPVYSVNNGHATEIIRRLRLCLSPVDGEHWECYDPSVPGHEVFGLLGNPTHAIAERIPHVVCLAALKTVLFCG